MSNLKICHIMSGDLWAGAEVMGYHLVRELLDCHDLNVSVYLLNEGRLAEKLRELPVELTVANEQQCSFFQLLTSFRKWLICQRPQVIHSHRYKENILACLASGFGRRAKLLATQHSLPESGPHRLFGSDRFVSGLNMTLLRNRFDKVVGVSNNICDYIIGDCGIPAERLAVINNGVDLPSLPSSSAQSEQFVVGSAGRLFPVKDYPLLVDSAHNVAKEAPEVRFMLAGDGPELSNIETKVSAYGLQSQFVLIGHQVDIPAFYDSLDVYVNTSEHEGIPMSILEAMAHGLPVVAPDVGGIGEIIEDGVDGFLVAGRSPEDFASPILKLQDAKLRRRIGEAAREKIRRSFSAQSMAAQYYQLYRELAT